MCSLYTDPGCELRAIGLISDTSIRVNSSDGRHASVQLSVVVNVNLMSNSTLDSTTDSTTVIKVSTLQAAAFMRNYYRRFVDSVHSFSPSGTKLRIRFPRRIPGLGKLRRRL